MSIETTQTTKCDQCQSAIPPSPDLAYRVAPYRLTLPDGTMKDFCSLADLKTYVASIGS